MFNKIRYSNFLQVVVLCSYAAHSGSDGQLLDRCSAPSNHHCTFSSLNVTEASLVHCSAEYIQGSSYHPPIMSGHYGRMYRKIECEAPEQLFHNLDLSGDHNNCPNNVGQISCETKSVRCMLIGGHESCWQITIEVMMNFEAGDSSSVIQLYGITKNRAHGSTDNTEYYCIYIRPTEHDPHDPAVKTSTEISGLSPSLSGANKSTTSPTHSILTSSVLLRTVSPTTTTSSLPNLSPSMTSFLHHPSSSKSREENISPSCSAVTQSSVASIAKTTPPVVNLGSDGLVLSSKNARTLIIALGSALTGISIAFTISCICNMVLIRKHCIGCGKRKFTVESSEGHDHEQDYACSITNANYRHEDSDIN